MIRAMAILLVLGGISVAYAKPSPFVYSQQPISYLYPQQAMHRIHYQNQQLRNQAPSTGVSASAARNNIAIARYLNDCKNRDVGSAISSAQDPNVSAMSEAYPEEQNQQADVSQDEQIPLENVPQHDVTANETEEPIADYPVSETPTGSEKTPNNKKKVVVQLDSEEEEQDTQMSHLGANHPATPTVYFPIDFGSTNGAAIAIANSYSTGKGGSALSTATAYGSPAAAELKKLSPAQLKRRPTLLRTRQ